MRALRLLLLVVLLFSVVPVSAQGGDDDCDPDALGEWLVQRQIRRNELQPIIEGETDMNILEALLLIQGVRRDLEDLPRPACADELYGLTMYFYNAMIDHLTFQLAQNMQTGNALITPRIQYYWDNVEPVFLELEEIAGIDVDMAAAQAEPVPTEVSVPTGSRSNPYPIGESALFSDGQLRVLEIEDGYQPESYTVGVGRRIVAVTLEWVCAANEDESCNAAWMTLNHVTEEGNVVEPARIYDEPYWRRLEGFSGATLTGNLYFELPLSAQNGLLRVTLDRENVFFSLE